jgi:hypothetical protein
LFVGGTVAVFGLAFVILMLVKFTLSTFGVIFLICLVRLIVQECVKSIPLDMDHTEYLTVMRKVKATFRS